MIVHNMPCRDHDIDRARVCQQIWARALGIPDGAGWPVDNDLRMWVMAAMGLP